MGLRLEVNDDSAEFQDYSFLLHGNSDFKNWRENLSSKECNRNAPIWPGTARSDEVEVNIWLIGNLSKA